MRVAVIICMTLIRQTHASHARTHELRDVMPRASLRGFASPEKVRYIPAPPPLLPSHHSAPSVLPNYLSHIYQLIPNPLRM
ncbi:hypothetical protein F5148DRAFT_1234901 [Russula earlei]|uniref:Uncharacterized protein n=2 Tax=Russula earlei TaxID=71964 RepID=A0ACC0TYR2_9AGAM|nr:hypothetical protein F5148DRAFT_1258037 [Russula earlei]KAI9452823.1 hypothetical protein F5148DRAFT_1234901 [Russula earlei]